MIGTGFLDDDGEEILLGEDQFCDSVVALVNEIESHGDNSKQQILLAIMAIVRVAKNNNFPEKWVVESLEENWQLPCLRRQ